MSTEEKNEVIAKWMGFAPVKRMPRAGVIAPGIAVPILTKRLVYHKTDNEELKEVREINNEGLAIFELGIGTPKDEVFEAVYQFIEWHNSNVKEK